MASLELKGALSVNGGCGPCGSSGDLTVRRLALRCSGFSPYESVAETPAPIRVSTPGAAGESFVPLDIADGFTAVEFLYAVTDTPMVLRISDGPAVLDGCGCPAVTGFVGGEAFSFTIDNVTVAGTFQAGDQTLADVLMRLNSAAAAAGLPTPRFVATSLVTFKVVGIATKLTTLPGPAFSGIVFANSLPAPLSLPATPYAVANGNDVEVFGTMLVELPSYPNAPTTIEVSGVGAIRALVAGRTSP